MLILGYISLSKGVCSNRRKTTVEIEKTATSLSTYDPIFFSSFAVNASLTLMVGLFLSHLILSMACALLLTLAFESPFIRLEKLLIGAMLRPASHEEKKKPV